MAIVSHVPLDRALYALVVNDTPVWGYRSESDAMVEFLALVIPARADTVGANATITTSDGKRLGVTLEKRALHWVGGSRKRGKFSRPVGLNFGKALARWQGIMGSPNLSVEELVAAFSEAKEVRASDQEEGRQMLFRDEVERSAMLDRAAAARREAAGRQGMNVVDEQILDGIKQVLADDPDNKRALAAYERLTGNIYNPRVQPSGAAAFQREPEGGVFSEPSRSMGGSRKRRTAPRSFIEPAPRTAPSDALATKLMELNPELFTNRREAKRVLSAVLGAIREQTVEGGEVKLQSFGRFGRGGTFKPSKGIWRESFRASVQTEAARRGLVESDDLIGSLLAGGLNFVYDLLAMSGRKAASALGLGGEDPEQVKAAVEVIAQETENEGA